ncbi:MAG: energy transducer TonB [candidate division WOR-3 bacterium]|nr:MAG: energy transducer TonB [candidate division WOR-3 bacterium]
MKIIRVFFCLVALSMGAEKIQAITDNGATVSLREDETWMLIALPEGAEMKVSPLAVTEDSQLVLLKERKWQFVSADDTTGESYDTIFKPVVPHNKLSKEPHLRDIPGVVYPSNAATKRQQGSVVLGLLLDTDGSVLDVKVLVSTGYMELDNAAKRNGWKAKFSPPEFNGLPVRTWVSMPIDFKLQEP